MVKSVNRILIMAAVLFLTACATPTRITAVWTDNPKTFPEVGSVVVFATVNDLEARMKAEMALSQQLTVEGLEAVPGMKMFSPDFLKQSDHSNAVSAVLKEKGVDAVMMVSVKRVDQEENFVPGPYYGNPYYYRFYGPYGGWNDGYVSTSTEILLETNIYDVNTDKLLYKSQSRTVDPSSVDDTIDSYVPVIIKDLKTKGLLPEKLQK